MDLAPGQVVDRYRIEAELASGGMATVYRVRHTTLDTQHALKVLQLPAKQLMERLIQEGRAQARLKHPNIVAVTDVIDVGGAPGLVMELVAGPSLHQLLKTGLIPVAQSDALARDILAAVAHAHEHGMVHRDLKPANVMLAIGRGVLTPKVTDFGLAKLLHLPSSATDKTASGLAMGTPAYMAPEQYRDAKSVDARADVFSLGAILYEMVAGRRAFDGEEYLQIYQAIAEGRYVPLSEVAPFLPDRMVRAITSALQVDPAARAPSAEALLALWTDGERATGMSMPPAPWPEALSQRAWSAAGAAVAPVTSEEDVATKMPMPTLEPRSGVQESDSLARAPAVATPPVTPAATSAPSTRELVEQSRASRAPAIAVLVAILALGVAVPLALVAGLQLGRSGTAEVAPAPTPEPVIEAVPPEREPAPEPTPATPAPPPAPAPAPAPPPAPAAPRPAPEPAFPTDRPMGTVDVERQGAVDAVFLFDREGTAWPPGPVPAGTYTLKASFAGSDKDKYRESVVVVAGRTVRLKCVAQFKKCVPV